MLLVEWEQAMIKVYMIPSVKGYELLYQLDKKNIPYEVCEPSTEWSALNKIKSLPVIEVEGKLLEYKKALRWIKKQRGD